MALRPDEKRQWSAAGAIALAAHLGVGAWILSEVRRVEPIVPEPVVLIELPPAAVEAVQAPSEARPERQFVPQQAPSLPVEVPLAQAPLPRDAVVLPPAAPPRIAAPPPISAAPAAQVQAGDDPAAGQAEADYKSLVGSYIRRNRFSPPQSKRAGLSGNVKVRFVVDRRGAISQVTTAQSSGHDLLDGEAMQFIQRLTPVPAFPRDLKKAEIPLTITLKFELERK